MVLKNRYLTWFLFGMLFVSVMVAITISVRRYRYENYSNRVEMAVSYREMEQLATLGSVDTISLLKTLHEKAHITSVSVEEDTLEDFVDRGKVTVLKGSEIINMYRVGHVNRFLLTHLYKKIKVKPNRFYLIVEEKGDYERIRDFLSVEFGKDNVSRIGRLNILEVIDLKEDLMGLGLGISEARLTMIKSLGMQPIIRLKNSNRLNKLVIKQKLLSFVNSVPESTLIFEGDTVLGYPNHLSVVEEKIRDNRLRLGFVEFSKRLGEKQLAVALPERVVRVHTITDKEMTNLSMKRSVQRYVRAARERGIKILFIRPFFQGYHEESMIDFNIRFMTSIYKSLESHDKQVLPLDPKQSDSYQSAMLWEILILSLGVLTTIIFLLNFFVNVTIGRFLLINGIFVVIFYLSVLLQGVETWVQLMSIVTAIIFPCLALISQFPSEARIIGVLNQPYQVVLYLLKLLGITLVGAFLIIGFLSDITFIEGVSRFWGVKLSFVVPLFIVAVYYFFKPHRLSSTMYIIKRLYHAPVNTAGILAMGVVFSFVALLLLRSGNYIPMPQLFYEEQARDFLERLLFVRPRTKEFLIGYPVLFFAYVAVDRYISRHWIWLFNVIGLVALISVVNSFCHIHTPLNISLYRTCLGLVMGVVVGCVYFVGFKALYWVYRRLLR